MTLEHGGGAKEVVRARTVLWAAGVEAVAARARSSPQAAGAATDRAGRVVVEPDLTLPGHPELFVVGDLALFTHQDGHAASGRRAGRDAAGPVRRARRSEARLAGTHGRAVPLRRQGEHGDDRPGLGGRRRGGAPVRRLPRLARPGSSSTSSTSSSSATGSSSSSSGPGATSPGPARRGSSPPRRGRLPSPGPAGTSPPGRRRFPSE